jgi:hypothetical protein
MGEPTTSAARSRREMAERARRRDSRACGPARVRKRVERPEEHTGKRPPHHPSWLVGVLPAVLGSDERCVLGGIGSGAGVALGVRAVIRTRRRDAAGD